MDVDNPAVRAYNMRCGNHGGCPTSGHLEIEKTFSVPEVSRLVVQAAYFLFILDLMNRNAATSAVPIVQIFAKAESTSTQSPP